MDWKWSSMKIECEHMIKEWNSGPIWEVKEYVSVWLKLIEFYIGYLLSLLDFEFCSYGSSLLYKYDNNHLCMHIMQV